MKIVTMNAGKSRMRRSAGILLRERGNPRALYLVARRPELAFFGGYWAFPGGVVDAEDSAIAADTRATGAMTTTTATTTTDGDDAATASNNAAADEAVLRVAAARELFEETGILCVRSAVDAGSRAAWRDALLRGTTTFSQMLDRHGLEIDAARFTPVCWMTTPIFSPVRYETLFFLVETGADESPSILDGELTSGQFVAAGEILARWRAGDVLVVPPAIILLRLLDGARGPDPVPQFLAAARGLTESYARGKIHQVFFTPGVQKLPLVAETLPPADHTNAYLVGQDPAYLVDPGASRPEEHAKLFEALDEAIAGGVRLHAVLLTHAHTDHVRAVPAVLQRYGVPLWAHADAVPALAGVATVARTLVDGDVLPLGTSPDGRPGWTLEVLHTPGHAHGHLAFRESRYGAMLAGDLVSTVSTIIVAPPEGHLATYLASLGRLRKWPAGTLYPAHGPAKRDSHAVIDAYLAHRAERERKVISALGPEPRLLDDILPHAYDDVVPEAWPLARKSLEAGLIKLCEERVAEHSAGGYRLAAGSEAV